MTRHLAFLAFMLCAPAAAIAQIDTSILERHKAAIEKQTTDPDQKREGGTQPRDWDYQLPEGVRTRQVTFYVDGGTALYGKLFLPKGFTTTGKLPAVVVGHGINALSIGIEKFAARFAERGLVAMAIDYQSYGFSSSGSDDIRLLEADPTIGSNAAVTEKEMRILLKRTNLNNVHEVADFRAAVSFLQGEPGVDPDKIGIWGSSNGGSVVVAVAAVDARVKAVVSQVAGPRPAPRAPVPMGANLLQDAIKRVREGQGAEVDGGFSFRSKVDQWSTQRNRDVRPGQTLDQIRPTTAVLFLPAEKDELTQGPSGAIEASKFLSSRGVPSQAIVFPGLTHFQAYSNAGFEIGSNLAADWFLKYLPAAKPVYYQPSGTPGNGRIVGGVTGGSYAAPPPYPSIRDITFFSEGIRCHARLYLPPGFSAASNVAAVIVSPNRGQTAEHFEEEAAAIARAGLLAMAIDYRGWGNSGAFIYLAEPIRWDDRLRFSQHTAKIRLRRGRDDAMSQITDIRNAITFIQGEPGVDANRIGLLGLYNAGDHAVTIGANDARVKAIVTMETRNLNGGQTQGSYAPPAALQALMVRLARSGQAPATEAAARAMNMDESRAFGHQYALSVNAAQIPKETQTLFQDRVDAKAAAEFLAKALAPK